MSNLPLILMDTKESNKKIKKILHTSTNVELEVTHLDVGDFLIGKSVIERKTTEDFVSSIRDNRLLNQVRFMKLLKEEYGMKPYILIEGDFRKVVGLKRISWIQLNNIRNELLTKYEVQYIPTYDAVETAYMLISHAVVTAPENDGVDYLSVVREACKPEWSIEEKKRYMLQGIRGIGVKTADEILADNNYDLLRAFADLAYNTKKYSDKTQTYGNARKILLGN